MIEIGLLKTVPAVKGFGKNAVRVLDADGQPVTKSVPNQVWRVTRGRLNGHFCADRGRRLIVGLVNGDLLSLRPEGRLKRTAEVTIALQDVYTFCLRNKALNKQLEKARTRKTVLAAARERRNIKNAEKRLRRPL